jgi:hypothetical protein
LYQISSFPRDCIVSIGWLTIIRNNHFLATGLKEFTSAELTINRDDYKIYVLKAGPKPILGDRNRQEDCSKYIKLYQLLNRHICLQLPLPPGFDEEFAINWRQRFNEE